MSEVKRILLFLEQSHGKCKLSYIFAHIYIKIQSIPMNFLIPNTEIVHLNRDFFLTRYNWEYSHFDNSTLSLRDILNIISRAACNPNGRKPTNKFKYFGDDSRCWFKCDEQQHSDISIGTLIEMKQRHWQNIYQQNCSNFASCLNESR